MLLGLIAVPLIALSIPQFRRQFFVAPAFRMVKGILPKVSDTEQQALDAGTVGFDAELFSGTPDWAKLRAVPPIVLTKEEQAFLDGPTDELCTHDRRLGGAVQSSPDPGAHLGLRQEARLSRHAHFQGAWRPRIFAAGADR